jgi:hypothetical protein
MNTRLRLALRVLAVVDYSLGRRHKCISARIREPAQTKALVNG